MDITAYFNFSDPLVIRFVIDLAFAIAFGACIGAEREVRGKDAGMSTHIFVLCGAMLFTLMSSSVDPASQSRIAAQIVTGIGFLGAGLILKDGPRVRNLTTAASIWFAGAIGMTLGFGHHEIALIATLASVLIPRIPHVKKEVRQNYAARHKNDPGESTGDMTQNDD